MVMRAVLLACAIWATPAPEPHEPAVPPPPRGALPRGYEELFRIDALDLDVPRLPGLHELDLHALLLDAPCDEALPSKSWVCVRAAPKRAEWDWSLFGFTADEVTGQKREGDFEQDERAEFAPPRLSGSPRGFSIVKMPDELFRVLQRVWQVFEKSKGVEGPMHGSNSDVKPWGFADLATNSRLYAWVGHYVRLLLEAWSPLAGGLEFVKLYGFREYTRDAMLMTHRDRSDTHLLGAALQVAQDTSEGWPLHIADGTGEYAEVYLQPGWMVFYESSRLLHGRPRRFSGSSFVNLFVHACPYSWDKRERRLKDGVEPPYADERASARANTGDCTFGVESRYAAEAELLWFKPVNGELVSIQRLQSGTTSRMKSFDGHRFRIRSGEKLSGFASCAAPSIDFMLTEDLELKPLNSEL